MAPNNPDGPDANDPYATRRSPGDPNAPQHATQRIDPTQVSSRGESGYGQASHTQRIDPRDVDDATRDRPVWEGEAAPLSERPNNAGQYTPEPAEPESRRGKGAMLLLGGFVIGILVAFVVIALGSDRTGTDEAGDEVAALTAELEDRDAQIADMQAQLDAADTAAGDEAAALQEQRDALDDRATGLDQRAQQLDDREAALDQREQDLQELESQPPPEQPQEQPEPEQETPEPESEQGQFEAPDLPSTEELEQQAESIVDQVLDGIRNLFGND